MFKLNKRNITDQQRKAMFARMNQANISPYQYRTETYKKNIGTPKSIVEKHKTVVIDNKDKFVKQLLNNPKFSKLEPSLQRKLLLAANDLKKVSTKRKLELWISKHKNPVRLGINALGLTGAAAMGLLGIMNAPLGLTGAALASIAPTTGLAAVTQTVKEIPKASAELKIYSKPKYKKMVINKLMSRGLSRDMAKKIYVRNQYLMFQRGMKNEKKNR